jgi:uncharacterized membrane protein
MGLLKEDRFNILLVAAFSIFAVTPLFKPEFFVSNDLLGAVYRLVELDVSLKDGVLFSRWSPDLYGGLGGPLFNFYAPFSYYVAELFHLTGLSFVKSIKATYIVSFVLSGILMYMFAGDRMNRNGAFTAAILYMYAPYRFEDVYARGAFAESFTFVFLPFILFSFHRLAEQKTRRYFVLSSLTLAGLILTHNAIGLFFTGFLLVYLSFLLYKFPSTRVEVMIAIVLALGISSFFWLPAIGEKDHTAIEENILIYDYHDFFLKANQIIPNPADILTKSNNVNHLAAQVGIVHLIGAIFAIYFVRSTYVLFLFLMLLVVLFFMSSPSAIFWENIPLVRYTQFPSRLFAIVALLTSMLGGFFISRILKNKGRKEYIRVIFISILITCSSFNHIGSEGHIIYSDQDFTPEKIREYNTGLTYNLDYFPKDATYLSKVEMKDKVEVFRGDARVKIINEKSTLIKFESIGDASLMRINTYWFPGWTAYVDSVKKEIEKDENGLMLLEVPAGKHSVLVRFEDTKTRRIANTLSLVTLVILLVLSACPFLLQDARGRRHDNAP